MVEAKVVAVSDAKTKQSLTPEGTVQTDEVNSNEFNQHVKAVADRYKNRWGVIVGDTHIIVHASHMTGRKYICGNKGKITLEKQWSKMTQPYALQTTRKDILVHDPSFTQYRQVVIIFKQSSFTVGHLFGHTFVYNQLSLSNLNLGKIKWPFIWEKVI